MSNLLHYLTPEIQERFEAKFTRGNHDECWIWTAGKNGDGYGRMWVPRQMRGANAYAHRISWTLENQADIPDGLCVMHRCDNPPCINPAHLSVGTSLDNRSDSVAKLRHNIGERNGNARLSEEQVTDIFFDSRRYARIAADFGITRQQVSAIKEGRRWQHLGLKGA